MDWLVSSIDTAGWSALGVLLGVLVGVPTLVITAWTLIHQLSAAREARLAKITLTDPQRYQTAIRTWAVNVNEGVQYRTGDQFQFPPKIGFELWLLNEGQATARHIDIAFRFGSHLADRSGQAHTLDPDHDAQLLFYAPLHEPAVDPPTELIRLTVRYEDKSNDSPYEIEYCFRLGSDARSDMTTWQAHQVDCTTETDVDRPARARSVRQLR